LNFCFRPMKITFKVKKKANVALPLENSRLMYLESVDSSDSIISTDHFKKPTKKVAAPTRVSQTSTVYYVCGIAIIGTDQICRKEFKKSYLRTRHQTYDPDHVDHWKVTIRLHEMTCNNYY